MVSGNITICGLYTNFAGVRECAHFLGNAGVHPSDISLLLQNGSIVSAALIAGGDTCPSVTDECHPAERGSLGLSSGSLTRTLLTLGIPGYDAERLTERIRNGGILVMVRCKDFDAAERVKAGFIGTGAHDLSSGRKPGTELQRFTEAGYSQRSAQYRTAHA